MVSAFPSRSIDTTGAIFDDAPKLQASYLNAGFRVGQPQYYLKKGKADAAGEFTWDPSHDAPASPIHCTASVSLDVSPTQARWSVGTNQYLTIPGKPDEFDRIREIWVIASLGPQKRARRKSDNADPPEPQRLVQWNNLELTFIDERGGQDRWSASCLPIIQSPRRLRRAATRPRKSQNQVASRGQYARFRVPETEKIVEIQIRGQITLSGNLAYEQRAAMGRDDLCGNVIIFTDKRPSRRVKAKR